MKKRNLYLKNTPMEEALNKYMGVLEDLVKPQEEIIPVEESCNRITTKAIYAKYSSPMFNAAAMDGIAVRAKSTRKASDTSPVILKKDEDFIVVDTGDPVLAPFDAVIMAENIVETEEGDVQIFASVAAWEHVRNIGEDIVAGEMILPRNHKIRPMDIGVILAAGILEVAVLKRPEVAIFPTGTEIIEPTATPKMGDIIESNSRVFENLVVENGGVAHRFAPIPDEYDLIKEKIWDAAQKYDVVIVNAGSSAGTEDFTVHVIRELGEVVIHGVAVKPGKPVILGVVNNKPVIGLPGYPVAAYLNFEYFVIPVLKKFGILEEKHGDTIRATLSKRLISTLKYREYVRVKVGRVGDKVVAAPLSRGSGSAMSLVRADGFCVIEQNEEGVEAGSEVEVLLSRPKEDVDNTTVVIGSHDIILDVIADIMPNCYRNTFVSSTHVGSAGGLMALRRGEAHIAPIHLLDEETGVYNISYLEKLGGEPVVLVKGVERIQGIMVKKGNPLKIHAIEDLTKVRFVNRQRGAGTRILFDYKLKQLGIAPLEIEGYDREMNTHMAVAAAVASDSADAALGVYSAAKALGLDFIEVAKEEYDFAIPVRFLECDQIKRFLEILTSEEFRQELDRLGGYGYARIGEIIRIGE